MKYNKKLSLQLIKWYTKFQTGGLDIRVFWLEPKLVAIILEGIGGAVSSHPLLLHISV